MPTLRILLDNNVPVQLIPLLRPNEAIYASKLGWGALSNGDLIRSAHAAAFEVIVTCDHHIQHQQNLSGRPLAFVVLGTTHRGTILDNCDMVSKAVNAARPGTFTVVPLPRPPRRRRPFNPSPES